MGKKFICAFLSACLISSVSQTALAAETAFSDTSGHWAETQIETWAGRGIVQGDSGAFHPNAYITRGAAAVIIDRVMRYTRISDSVFSDLDPQSYCAESIRKLTHAGVIRGYADGTAHPSSFITRQEAVVMLSRAFRVSENIGATPQYKDQDTISSFAVNAVMSFTAAGYVHGNQANMFRPKDPITRAEFVTVLNNMVSDIVSTNTPHPLKSDKMLVISRPDTTLSGVRAETIFISAGAGEGEIMLNDVTADRLFVLGGGIHSVLIRGKSAIQNIQIAKQDSGVRLSVSKGADVEIVHIQDGCDDVILNGIFKSVAVDSCKNTIRFSDATVNSLSVAGAETKIFIDKNTNVKTLSVAASASRAQIDTEGTIGSVSVDNDSAKVITSGSGSVGGGNGGSSSGGSSSGGSSGDGSSSGGSSGGESTPDQPVTHVFGVKIQILGKGTVYAEEVALPVDPDPEPKPPVIDPIPDPEGYPLLIQTGAHGMALAEEVTEPTVPEPEPEIPPDFIVRINVSGKGTIVIQEIGE